MKNLEIVYLHYYKFTEILINYKIDYQNFKQTIILVQILSYYQLNLYFHYKY
jgi:hypothetical protein